jgi:hypothetical protein
MRWPGEAIVRVLGRPCHLHEPNTSEIREVARDEGLREMKQIDEVADAQLARSKQVQDPQPRRVGESAEERLKVGDNWGGGSWSHDGLSLMREDAYNLYMHI